MISIRRELQLYLENEVRILNDWSVNKAVEWEDIERLCNNSERMFHPHPVYDRNTHWIFSDCVDIDHLEFSGRGFIEYTEDVAKQNVSTILSIIERYRGVVLTDYI
jgi:hypothetical protein